MGKKMNGTGRSSKIYSLDTIGYVQNEDKTVLIGLLDEEKKQMKFVTGGYVYRFDKEANSYVLSSSYGHREINCGLPINEAKALAKNVTLDKETAEDFSNLKSSLSKRFYSSKELVEVEGDFNGFVHDVKHLSKKQEECEPQM